VVLGEKIENCAAQEKKVCWARLSSG
jgi:hypothetical protein